jgi:SAM-dependent methyltransferase
VIGNGCNYFGTDYNRGYVDWCTKNLPGIQFKGNDLTPPLAFGSNTFDALYGISIFTHLSEEMHRAWFAELMRVLRPGGLAMLTTHGDATRVNLTPEEQTQYDRNELVVRGHVKEGHRMYAAYQPPAFMRQLATGQEALVLEHIPGKREHWGIGQDVWVFQKKG